MKSASIKRYDEKFVAEVCFRASVIAAIRPVKMLVSKLVRAAAKIELKIELKRLVAAVIFGANQPQIK